MMNIIFNTFANIARILPKKIRMNITRKISDKFIDMYSDIEVVNGSIVEKRRGIPTIYIGNHLSNIDGVVLNRLLRDNNVAFMAGVKLSKNLVTNLVLETIKTINITPDSADKEAIKEAIKYLKDGGSIFIFPEGTRSRSSSMIQAKKGFLLLSKMSKAQLLPVALEGTEKLLPISSDSMSKENFNHSKVKITFGEPFSLPEKTEDNKANWTELATDYSMRKISKLLDPRYRGIYK